jgi:hypothetical protein
VGNEFESLRNLELMRNFEELVEQGSHIEIKIRQTTEAAILLFDGRREIFLSEFCTKSQDETAEPERNFHPSTELSLGDIEWTDIARRSGHQE